MKISTENNLAPIVLFVYNRPWHTQQTVSALLKNKLSAKSELYIYADGSKKESDKQVEKVRQYIKTIAGFKKTTIIERNKNFGLADNIIDGVTNIVNKYGKIIVLEDDIVTSSGFLKYMNDALLFYENEEKVMTISSYLYPINSNSLPDTFLLKPSGCWGWATWSRSWAFFDKNVDNIISKFTKQDIYTFNINNSYDFWQQIKANKKGILKTWAVFWLASMFLNNGFTLFPKNSFSINIGHDNSGMHCVQNNWFETNLTEKNVIFFPNIISENISARNELIKYFKKIKLPFYKRYFNKLTNHLK